MESLKPLKTLRMSLLARDEPGAFPVWMTTRDAIELIDAIILVFAHQHNERALGNAILATPAAEPAAPPAAPSIFGIPIDRITEGFRADVAFDRNGDAHTTIISDGAPPAEGVEKIECEKRFRAARQDANSRERPPVERRDQEWFIAGWKAALAYRASEATARPAAQAVPLSDAQIKHMVARFLAWKLPDDFAPDGGITFVPTYNDGTAKRQPTGTNLLDATQAAAMVRHMIDDLPSPAAQAVTDEMVEAMCAVDLGADRWARMKEERPDWAAHNMKANRDRLTAALSARQEGG